MWPYSVSLLNPLLGYQNLIYNKCPTKVNARTNNLMKSNICLWYDVILKKLSHIIIQDNYQYHLLMLICIKLISNLRRHKHTDTNTHAQKNHIHLDIYMDTTFNMHTHYHTETYKQRNKQSQKQTQIYIYKGSQAHTCT